MRKILSAAGLSMLAATPASANKVWDFQVTSIACPFSGTCSVPSAPLAELVLPGPDSAGSAKWATGYPILPGDPPPVHTGDDFRFQSGRLSLSPTNLIGQPGGPGTIRFYDISWVEVAGNLEAIHIDWETWGDDETLGLTSGRLASDGEIGGCVMSTGCQFSGVWVDPPGNVEQLIAAAVPEPSSLSLGLTAAAFFGLMWVMRSGTQS